MRYSFNWLKEISGTKSSVQKVAENLTMKSFEVENLEHSVNGLDGVIVGKILEIKKHPNADKLQIATVDVGSKKLEIICGAPNIQVGQKVPVAMLGAKLPNGEIKEVEIRGVKSCGMLCAEDELGLGNDHSGIMILDTKSKVGVLIVKEINLEDDFFEIKVLPDRGHDAQSYVGVAREIAALENRKMKYAFNSLKLPNKKTKKLSIEIKDKDLCPRYMGTILENIKIKESPFWIKTRLLASGIRPINNIVDATNYVMLELGQPLHAFDFDLIKSADQKAEIIVRRAKKDEKIKLLDETEKILSQEDLLITNGQEALAIAGIMGGLHSGINEKTQTIVLESANFNATAIRKTRTKLNIKTDASDRFEKDIDPNLAEKAMARVVAIIQETAGGKVEGIVDVYPKKIKPWKIKLDLNYVNKLLGEKIPTSQVQKILNLLEIQTKSLPLGKGKKQEEGVGVIEAEIPTFRIDLQTQEDLIEEIGRIYGYEKIKPQAPKVHLKPAKISEQLLFEREIKNILVGLRFDEVYNYSFYGFREAEMAGLKTTAHWELENPMNPEQSLMRTSLVPNLLKNIHENLKHFKELFIFEMGRTYHKSAAVLPEEKRMLVGAVVLEKIKQAENFYAGKGFVDALFSQIGISDYYYDDFKAESEEKSDYLWHRSRMAEIKVESQKESIGFIGEINPLILANFDIEKRVVMFEFDLEKLKKVSESEREFDPISKFPEITRDISLLSEVGVTVDDIIKVIQKTGSSLILDVDLFDIFEKDGKTSYAFHLIFGSKKRTLEGSEVEVIMARLISELEKSLKVVVRQ
jgi:phenylalanyl-tRNA synthetase beta chain